MTRTKKGNKMQYVSPLIRLSNCHFMPNPLQYHPTLEDMLEDSGLLVTPEPLRKLQIASVTGGRPYKEANLSNYDYLCTRQNVFGLISSQTVGIIDPEEEEAEKKKEGARKRGRGRRHNAAYNIRQAMYRSLEKPIAPLVNIKEYLKEGASPGRTLQTPQDQRHNFRLDIHAVAGEMVEEFREINLACYCREDGVTIPENGARMRRMELPLLSPKEAKSLSQMAHNQINNLWRDALEKSITTKQIISFLMRLEERWLNGESMESIERSLATYEPMEPARPKSTRTRRKKKSKATEQKRRKTMSHPDLEDIDSPEEWSDYEENPRPPQPIYIDISSDEEDLDKDSAPESTSLKNESNSTFSTSSTPLISEDLTHVHSQVPTTFKDHLFAPIPTDATQEKVSLITKKPTPIPQTEIEREEVSDEFPPLPSPKSRMDFTHIDNMGTPLIVLPVVSPEGRKKSMEELNQAYEQLLSEIDGLQ